MNSKLCVLKSHPLLGYGRGRLFSVAI